MSSTGDIISFDLKKGNGSVIDISALLPLTDFHVLEQGRSGKKIDAITRFRPKLNLVEKMRVSVNKFETYQTLDIATDEIRKVTGDTLTRQKRVVIASDPLYIPYGSLDIRRLEKYKRGKTHPDLFKRSLPYGLMIRRGVKGTGHFLRKHKRHIVITIGVFVVMSVPLLIFVKMSIEKGYQEILTLSNATGSRDVQLHIKKARGYFERSRVVFLPFSWVPQDDIRGANAALRGGLSITRALDTLSQTLPLQEEIDASVAKSQNILPSFRGEARDFFFFSHLGIESPTNWLYENHDTFLTVKSYLFDAADAYMGVSGDDERIRQIQEIGKSLQILSKSVNFYLENEDEILEMLGHNDPKRYIIFNQNRDEIRANGGFPGTVFTFTLYKGNILDYRQDDVYYYDWNLYPYKEIPPPGIALMTDAYGLRDVNYYPDFRETLERANSFVERSGDSTLTTGIAIHQGIIEDILSKIGEVRVVGVSEPFTGENFSTLMSTLVELQYGRENHAKDILFDFVDDFIREIHETKSYSLVLDTVIQAWKSGQILFASRDQSTDEFLSRFREKLPWECDILENPECPNNWVYPVFTSVSGNKSDRYIERVYHGTTTKILGCRYENVLTLTHEHTFDEEDKKLINSYMDITGIDDMALRQKELFIQGNGKNKSFTRLYVPSDVELTFTGSDIGIERHKNYSILSFMLETPVSGKSSKTLRYMVNVPNCERSPPIIEWTLQPGLRKVLIK